jgi:hypothetical protein
MTARRRTPTLRAAVALLAAAIPGCHRQDPLVFRVIQVPGQCSVVLRVPESWLLRVDSATPAGVSESAIQPPRHEWAAKLTVAPAGADQVAKGLAGQRDLVFTVASKVAQRTGAPAPQVVDMLGPTVVGAYYRAAQSPDGRTTWGRALVGSVTITFTITETSVGAESGIFEAMRTAECRGGAVQQRDEADEASED